MHLLAQTDTAQPISIKLSKINLVIDNTDKPGYCLIFVDGIPEPFTVMDTVYNVNAQIMNNPVISI